VVVPWYVLETTGSAARAGVVAACELVPGAASRPTGAGYLRDLRDGLAYVARDRLVVSMVALVVVTNMLDRAFSAVLLPVYATDVLRPALLVGGAAYLLATAGPFVFPAWRQLDRENGHTVSRREVENGAAAPTQS